MGNRALRKELNALLPKRLYRGRKFAAFRELNASKMRSLIEHAKFQIGHVTNDCDYLNHKIIEVHYWYSKRPGKHLYDIDHTLDNGRYRCQCNDPCKPWSRELIEKYLKEAYSVREDEDHTTELELAYQKKLDADEHVVDENGFELPELTCLRKKK